MEAGPSILVQRGRLQSAAMNSERIRPDELFGEMHKQGYRRLNEIEWAILEAGGDISFIPTNPEQTGAKHEKGESDVPA